MTVADKSTGNSIEDFLSVQTSSLLVIQSQRAQESLALAKQMQSLHQTNEKAPPKRGLINVAYFFLGAAFFAAGFLTGAFFATVFLGAAFLAAGFLAAGAASIAGAWSW